MIFRDEEQEKREERKEQKEREQEQERDLPPPLSSLKHMLMMIDQKGL